MTTKNRAESHKMIWQRHRRTIARIIVNRRMVSFNEIAKWCARKDGSIQPDRNIIQYIYNELYISIITGEFGNENGRCLVVCFDRERPYLRLHREHVIDWGTYKDPLGDQFPRVFLQECFLPRELCTAWLVKRRQQPNPEWITAVDPAGEAKGSAASTAAPALQVAAAPSVQGQEPASAPSAVEPETTRRRRGAPQRELTRKALENLHGEPERWPGPSGYILDQVNEWLKTKGCKPVSMDTLQRAMDDRPTANDRK